MRILYGVVGEGMGHATRSRVVIEHLLAAGHEVHVLVSGRAHDMLQKLFANLAVGQGGVHRVHGWHLVYEDNEVKKARTLGSNLLELMRDLPLVERAWRQLGDFRPEVVLSDFESWSYTFGQAHHVPVISIDNMQIINRCEHDDEVLAGHRGEFLMTKGIVKSKLPGCRQYIVTTFFEPPLRKERTTLVPPILRPNVLAAQPTSGEHVLVYSSSDNSATLEAVLKGFPAVKFLVYGLRRGIDGEQLDGNLHHQPFSEQGFIDHLASARAVVAGGGFSLMSECVYLHKPMLSVPLAGQFEQLLNARYLQKLGFGLCREDVTAADVEQLLDRTAEFTQALAGYGQEGNRQTLSVVDEALAAV